jgi:hypothetical protein
VQRFCLLHTSIWTRFSQHSAGGDSLRVWIRALVDAHTHSAIGARRIEVKRRGAMRCDALVWSGCGPWARRSRWGSSRTPFRTGQDRTGRGKGARRQQQPQRQEQATTYLLARDSSAAKSGVALSIRELVRLEVRSRPALVLDVLLRIEVYYDAIWQRAPCTAQRLQENKCLRPGRCACMAVAQRSEALG